MNQNVGYWSPLMSLVDFILPGEIRWTFVEDVSTLCNWLEKTK